MRRLPGTKASLCERSAKGVRFSLSVPPWLGQEEVGRILAPLGRGTGGGVGWGWGCWRSHLSAVPACAALHPLPYLSPWVTLVTLWGTSLSPSLTHKSRHLYVTRGAPSP